MNFDENIDLVSTAAELIESETGINAVAWKFPEPKLAELPYIVVEESGVNTDGYADDEGQELITELHAYLITAEIDSLSRRTCDAAMLTLYGGYTSTTAYDEQDEVVIKMYTITQTEVYNYGE
jgi:hypothetical protein